MKRTIAGIIAAGVVAGLLGACASKPVQTPETGRQTGPRFSLRLEPGAHYSKKVGFAFFGYTVWPQVAVWVETLEGTYIDTIYVTAKGQNGNWMAAPKGGRPEALPVWYHLRQKGVDAVSAATTTDSAVVAASSLAARLPAGTYVVKLETNRSYDWNERYTEKNAGVSGQPSLIYRAELTIGGGKTEARFVPIGTGSVDGTDGKIRAGLDGIDTALDLFAAMTVSFEN